MATTPAEMMGTVSESLAERTGRTLAEWVAPRLDRHGW
jgi:hypothetical protein